MKKILVSSGKGGCGKTTVSIGIAETLKNLGYKVGIVDVDIDTPNLPEFMNIIERDLDLSDEGICPKIKDDIEMMSIGFIADPDKAIAWDGERRSMAIEQMINRVDWTCEYLVIDSPPGTAEELTTVIKTFTPDFIFIISTPHKASVSDVKRTIAMINLLGAGKKINGVIMNMDYIICSHCDQEIDVWGNGRSDDKEVENRVIDRIPYIDRSEISLYITNTIKIITEGGS